MTENQSSQPDEPDSEFSLSRRNFLKSTSGGAAAAMAASATSSIASARSSLTTQEQFLLDRITFGRSEEMVAEIQARGYQGFLDWQLQMPGTDPIDDSQLFVSGLPLLSGPDGPDKLALQEVIHPWSLDVFGCFFDQVYPHDIPTSPNNPFSYPMPDGGPMKVHAPLTLQMGGQYGQHQLRWVMTDFLQNVHNTLLAAPASHGFWLPFVRDVIYSNALGNYANLVKFSAQGGSMMLYLGQPNSSADDPNENYARELAELHTVGVNDVELPDYGLPLLSTFKESDILAFSRILTGWSIDSWGAPESGTLTVNIGDFEYLDGEHYYQDPNSPPSQCDKLVSMTGGLPTFGDKCYNFPQPTGQMEGESLIYDLATHPLCALHISQRLVQWFIGDEYDDPQRFRNVWFRTALAFYSTSGDIKATIRELFNPAFFDEICPPGTKENKVRRPVNKTLAFQRALQTTVDYSSPKPHRWIGQQLVMGQVGGFWPAPNGYQPENEKWTSTMLPTIQFYFDSIFGGTAEAALLGAEDNGLRIDDAYLDTVFASPATGTLAEKANQWLTGGCLESSEVTAVNNALSTIPNHVLPTQPGYLSYLRRWALFYTLVSPGYQYLC